MLYILCFLRCIKNTTIRLMVFGQKQMDIKIKNLHSIYCIFSQKLTAFNSHLKALVHAIINKLYVNSATFGNCQGIVRLYATLK